jgi:hypothetical protein
MSEHGVDVRLSQAGKALFPFSVECKAKATGFMALYDGLRQAERGDGLTPVLVTKQDAVARW